MHFRKSRTAIFVISSYFSRAHDDKTQRLSAQAMEGVLPLLQRRVAKELRTRITPELHLRSLDRLESLIHVDQQHPGLLWAAAIDH